MDRLLDVLGDIVAGSAVALVVAAIAWFGTDRFARRQEAARARHERSLAAAEELYAVYGGFFATWKAWEFARGRDRAEVDRVPAELRQELLEQAAEVEGRYESLVVRTALEHRLAVTDRTGLWALRFGLKELRTAIREDAPLGWWRTDDPATPEHHLGARKYVAFKALTARVAQLLVDADPRDRPPAATERADALAAITATLSPLPAQAPSSVPASEGRPGEPGSDPASGPHRLRGEQWYRADPR
ncbi:hypothetical protein [Nocardioides campestrisoli]|uniref:hypothetical protein n=1 Tax=Nocardioides campestrisoli TaxID=2736757 RepID=UPI0015E6491E|nr:hypothetical protein [Nocardioides campestrisoli]